MEILKNKKMEDQKMSLKDKLKIKIFDMISNLILWIIVMIPFIWMLVDIIPN